MSTPIPHFKNFKGNWVQPLGSVILDRFGGPELIMIDRWYLRQSLTNHKQRLSTKRSEIKWYKKAS